MPHNWRDVTPPGQVPQAICTECDTHRAAPDLAQPDTYHYWHRQPGVCSSTQPSLEQPRCLE